MYRIKLINMPFAALHLPSIGLTQIRAVTEQRFGSDVAIDVCYLNHDFGQYLGVGLYSFVAMTPEANTSGLGDWFFRQAAFPDMPDNADAYFRRYFPHRHGISQKVREQLLEKRGGIAAWIDRMIDKYALSDADLVGLTSMFCQNVSSFALARKLKERVPKIVVAMGGANCEPPMGQQIATYVPEIDFVFAGPGLRSFPDFVGHARVSDFASCAKVPGVYGHANAVNHLLLDATPNIGEERDINETVPLDYSDFLDSHARMYPDGSVQPSLLFETSRGCWWGARSHCTFCGLNGLTLRYREMEPRRAVESLNALFESAPSVWLYESVDNIMPKGYPSHVFPHLVVPDTATIFYEVKADITEADIAAMARGHVRLIQPGIESLATSTLKLMHKGTSAFQNVKLLKHCITYDIAPFWNLLVGFPGETEEVYRKYATDIPWLMHLPPPAGVSPVRFDRFSPYFMEADSYGLDLVPMDFYELVYPFSPAALRDLAYYFTDRNLAAPYFTVMVRWIGVLGQLVERWRARWSEGEAERFPRLHLSLDESDVVLDTRGGELTRHHIGGIGRRVLDAAMEPINRARVVEALGDLPPGVVDRTVADLRDRGLVFMEGDRMLSIVHMSEPAPPRMVPRLLEPPAWASL